MNGLEQYYRGTLTLEKETDLDLYYSVLTPLQSQIRIRVNKQTGKVFEGNHYTGWMLPAKTNADEESEV